MRIVRAYGEIAELTLPTGISQRYDLTHCHPGQARTPARSRPWCEGSPAGWSVGTVSCLEIDEGAAHNVCVR